MNTDKVDKAIMRLQEAAKMSETFYEKPLIITTSGGKDSDVCVRLAQMAKINCEFMHNHTTADAPETVYHIRNQFKELELQGYKCTVNMPVHKGKPVSMWTLIPQQKIPPTRKMRYCCAILKETGGKNRMIATGVRWAESARRRKTRGIYENFTQNKRNKIILTNDNDDTRRLFENCRIKAERICNPIIDWLDSDIWEFIAAEKIEVNPLYQCGFSRVGCVGCPMASRHRREKEFKMFPTYQRAYIRAFDVMIADRKKDGLPVDWETGIDVFHWWMEDGVLSGQLEFK